MKSKDIAIELFSREGIEVGGSNPWDISVHNEDFYNRVMTLGSLGVGESYKTTTKTHQLPLCTQRTVHQNDS